MVLLAAPMVPLSIMSRFMASVNVDSDTWAPVADIRYTLFLKAISSPYWSR